MDNKWQPKRRIEQQYAKALDKIRKLIDVSIQTMTDPFEIISKLKTLTNTHEFNDYCKKTAMKMVTHLFVDGAKTWRAAAKESAKGKLIYDAIKKELRGSLNGSFYFQINRNAEIIKTFPTHIANSVTNYISEEALKGRRATDIANDIREKFPHNTKANIDLIARTEVSKTSTALTQARAEEVGFNWYKWKTCKDQRVRHSHEHMDGVLVNFSNPPSPEQLVGQKSAGHYNAGCIYNCRCYPEVVVDVDRIDFPAKVYVNGAIRRMKLNEFKQIL
jgi:SPP1 gp7 family putative phage head morphogenesis protein